MVRLCQGLKKYKILHIATLKDMIHLDFIIPMRLELTLRDDYNIMKTIFRMKVTFF